MCGHSSEKVESQMRKNTELLVNVLYVVKKKKKIGGKKKEGVGLICF